VQKSKIPNPTLNNTFKLKNTMLPQPVLICAAIIAAKVKLTPFMMPAHHLFHTRGGNGDVRHLQCARRKGAG